MADNKVLVVVFDGLRPDMVTSALMPNLRRFADAHCVFPLSRAVFPTETRVNAAALVTGQRPDMHGLVANAFHAAEVFADHAINTAKMEHLVAADRAWNGALLTAPSLGERLYAQGKTLATVSTASTGSSWLLNHRAEQLGLLRWSSHGPAYSAPCLDSWRELAGRFGEPPPAAIPLGARIEHAKRIYLEHVWPVIDPDVAILWFADPDTTYHYRGIGSPETVVALRTVDAAFGEIVAAWRAAPDHDRRSIITLSDHGHVTTHERIDVVGRFTEAGFRADARAAGDGDLAVVSGSPSLVGLRRRDDGLARDLVAFLREQPWCGLIFAAGGDGMHGPIDGTLDRALLGVTHARSADLVFTLATDDEPGSGGWPGRTHHDYDIPAGGSMHGGLHPRELNNWLAAGGAAFREGYVSPCPAGITDITPTILDLLGLPPGGCHGRVLAEALRDGLPPRHGSRTIEARAGRYAQRLSLSRAGSTAYIDGGTILH